MTAGSSDCNSASSIETLQNANILNIVGLILIFVATVARPIVSVLRMAQPFRFMFQNINVFRVVIVVFVIAGLALILLAMRKDTDIQAIMHQSYTSNHKDSKEYLSKSSFAMTMRGLVITQIFLTFLSGFLIPVIAARDSSNWRAANIIINVCFALSVLLLGAVTASLIESLYIDSQFQTGISKDKTSTSCIKSEDIFTYNPSSIQHQMLLGAGITVIIVGAIIFSIRQ